LYKGEMVGVGPETYTREKNGLWL